LSRERSHISVVVPFRDVEAHIDTCVRALLAQDYPRDRFELLFIDNGSTDESAAIVRGHAGVRLLAESKVGAYAARNRGVAEARGSILAFTDSDCAPRDDWLRRIDEAFRGPSVGLILGCVRPARESHGLSALADYDEAKVAYVTGRDTKEIYYGYTNDMAVRRTLFDRVGPFLELPRGADSVFVHRVIDAVGCGAVRYEPRMRVTHLEVAAVRDWWRKMRIYGRSSRRYEPLACSRSLMANERLQVFRATARQGRLSTVGSLMLLLILVIGVLYYERGRWDGRAG